MITMNERHANASFDAEIALELERRRSTPPEPGGQMRQHAYDYWHLGNVELERVFERLSDIGRLCALVRRHFDRAWTVETPAGVIGIEFETVDGKHDPDHHLCWRPVWRVTVSKAGKSIETADPDRVVDFIRGVDVIRGLNW